MIPIAFGVAIMRVAIYLRVSTDEQAESGLSLSHQREKTKALADVYDWELVEVIQDERSAKNVNREGLQRVLSLVRSRKIEGVIVYKLDRLTRVQRDLMDLLAVFDRFGVSLVSVSEKLDTQSASGRFFVGMLGLIAQWERETIGERTQAAMTQLRKKGKRFSRIAPYGWRYDSQGGMVEVETEQETKRMIGKLSERGFSLRKIATELENQGRNPRNGKRWHPGTVASVLRNGKEGDSPTTLN
jgi:DNA invertase Pin-like site-specific DNA recombinase